MMRPKPAAITDMLGVAIEPTYFDLERERVEPAEIVGAVKEAGANTIRVGMFSHQGHAYYPSRVAPEAPGLNGRNLLREFEAACRRRGVNLAVYVNTKWVKALRRQHPDWAVRLARGPMSFRDIDPHVSLNIHALCPCSPFLEYVRAIIQEILATSSPAVLYLDNFGILPFCRCRFCRADHGRPIPSATAWTRPATQAYLTWLVRASRRLARRLVQTARTIRPGMPVVFNRGQFWTVHDTFSPEDNFAYAHRIGDAVHTESAVRLCGESFRHINEQCAFGRSIGLPVWTWVEYAMYPFSFTGPAAAEAKIKAAKVIANGGRPMVWNLPCGSGADRRGLIGIREVFKIVKRHRRYFNRVAFAAGLGIVFSSQSVRAYCQGQAARLKRCQQTLAGARDLAIRCHLPYDFVLDDQIEARALKRYAAVALPNAVHLTARQCREIGRYVAQGGAIFATHETSLCDRFGRHRRDFGLRDVMGVRYAGDLGPQLAGSCAGYARWVADHPLNGGGLKDHLFPLAGEYLAVRSGDAIARLLKRCRYYCDYPQPETAHPAIMARTCGQGRVVYVAGEFFHAYHRFGFLAYRTLFRQAMAWLTDERWPLKTDLPDTVELTIARNRDGAIIIHLVNGSFDEARPVEIIPPVSGRFLELATSRRFVRARDLATGARLRLQCAGRRVRLALPELTGYNVIVLE
ncbi:MAG: hypothetical protein HY360_08595 [Verrucomicrobia bacterium]|nr:hypothetical protein [Verrucomicrobiota bacterium]